jgi:hypothetical protein
MNFPVARIAHCHGDTYIGRMSARPAKVVRILGVGTAPDDGITRISKGDHYACFLGSEREHALLGDFCADLQALLAAMGTDLAQYQPEELLALIFAHGLHEGRGCAS